MLHGVQGEGVLGGGDETGTGRRVLQIAPVRRHIVGGVRDQGQAEAIEGGDVPHDEGQPHAVRLQNGHRHPLPLRAVQVHVGIAQSAERLVAAEPAGDVDAGLVEGGAVTPLASADPRRVDGMAGGAHGLHGLGEESGILVRREPTGADEAERPRPAGASGGRERGGHRVGDVHDLRPAERPPAQTGLAS
ncbi:hypothetical protein C5C41_08615 [Rathayibacter sp. AY1E9]|nr:hypothetical protein C5E14_03720 [Rathayibacter sp. AY1A1]PPG52779.1 hypothetical protein C5C41_08615 [Rathayibacter sp. AY1E9]PPG99750.1 hypothetical protein C5C32_10755 [Rathayibacter sp. AY1G9]